MEHLKEYKDYRKQMKSLVDDVIINKKGGDEYFDTIDSNLKLGKNVEMIQNVFNQMKTSNEFNVILTGGFGDWILTQIKKGNLTKPKNFIHVNGSIRGGDDKLGTTSKGKEVQINYKHGDIHNKEFIMFDDSYYSGSTEKAIKDFLKRLGSSINKTFVLYDGSDIKDDNRKSLYRYYDFNHGSEAPVKKMLNYLYDTNEKIPLDIIEQDIIKGKIKTIRQINLKINDLKKKFGDADKIVLNRNDEMKYESSEEKFYYTGLQSIERYIASGKDINKIFYGQTILQIIIQQSYADEFGLEDEPKNLEDVESINLLLDNGFTNIDYQSVLNSRFALYNAAASGYYTDGSLTFNEWPVKILLDAGANWFLETSIGKTFFELLTNEEIADIEDYFRGSSNKYWKMYLKKKNKSDFNL